MRKLLIAVFALLIMAPAAHAASAGSVGVVNVPKVILECEPGKEVRATLEKTFKGTKDEMDAQKAELDKMSQDLQKQSLVLSQEAKMDKEVEFKRKVRDYQDAMRDFQRKAKAEESRLAQPVIDLIQDTLTAYGKKHGLSLILDSKAGVLYAADASNLTNEIIAEVNKAWRARAKK
ncbi:OmpH/Skp family outer membrane protein [Desulfocurvus sp. DL9XJH121]